MTRTLWHYCSRVRNVARSVAVEYGVDPLELVEMAVALAQDEAEGLADVVRARRAARRYTGLTLEKIERLIDSGKDHTVVVGLDVMARSLAGEFPELGIGSGYDSSRGYEGIDHAERLWEVLRRPDPVARPQHDLGLVREAAEILRRDRGWAVSGEYVDEVPF